MAHRYLVITRKGDRFGEFTVDRAVVGIGRHRSNTIVLEDPNLSRHHAALMLDSESNCYLQDVGSKNGTFVNGRRITRLRLKAGDTFSIGAYKCTYCETEDASDSDGQLGAIEWTIAPSSELLRHWFGSGRIYRVVRVGLRRRRDIRLVIGFHREHHSHVHGGRHLRCAISGRR